jgi:hypothetical protein
MLTVNLEAKGNEDFRESFHFKDTAIVGTLEEASQECREYIKVNDLGGGNWVGGQVFDEQGNQIAAISYNGRIWRTDNSAMFQN